MRERSGGGAFNGVGETGGAALRNHHALCARSERRPHDCAKIMRVFDAVKKHEQTIGSFRAEQIVQFDGGFCGPERGDALMVTSSGEAVEL